MWSPWKQLADEFPEWTVRFGVLPLGQAGCTDLRHRTIWLSERLTQAGRRSTLAHELEHVRGGHEGLCCRVIEEHVEEIAARNLIHLDALVDVLRWTSFLDEAAEELNVDTATLAMRFRTLHPAERAHLRHVQARQDQSA